jgi:hypothetical protein
MHIARRDADLEARRASAGGVVVQAPALSGVPASNEKQMDAMSALASLKAMSEQGLITEMEYASKRSEILNRM